MIFVILRLRYSATYISLTFYETELLSSWFRSDSDTCMWYICKVALKESNSSRLSRYWTHCAVLRLGYQENSIWYVSFHMNLIHGDCSLVSSVTVGKTRESNVILTFIFNSICDMFDMMIQVWFNVDYHLKHLLWIHKRYDSWDIRQQEAMCLKSYWECGLAWHATVLILHKVNVKIYFIKSDKQHFS